MKLEPIVFSKNFIKLFQTEEWLGVNTWKFNRFLEFK